MDIDLIKSTSNREGVTYNDNNYINYCFEV